MKCTAILLSAVAGAFLCTVTVSAQDRTAGDELSQGVKAFTADRLGDAVAHFKLAVTADPKSIDAHLYLAHAMHECMFPERSMQRIFSEAIKRSNKKGIEELTEAIKLRPDYDDAMTYMYLMLTERADIQCGDDKAHNADVKAADSWIDKNIATTKARAKRATPPPFAQR
jgi:hypothetical protein